MAERPQPVMKNKGGTLNDPTHDDFVDVMTQNVEVHRFSSIFLAYRLVSWFMTYQKAEKYCHLHYRMLNTSPYPDAVLKSSGMAFLNPGTSMICVQTRIPMYCDNQSAMLLCCNIVQHTLRASTKHIDIRRPTTSSNSKVEKERC
ncbi:hypothetical protein Tco_0175036 [Tanacetum coccineum]